MSGLPKGWADARLGELVALRGEKVDPANVPDWVFVGLEDIEPHTSRILRTGKGNDVKSSVARFFAGDVLYSRLRPYLNKVTIPDFDGIASAEILVLETLAVTSAEFVRRQIMTREFLDFAALLDKGDRPRVNFKEIAEYSLPLPPLPEQTRIVAKIDGLTARTTRARAELERIPTLIARYKQRLLALAFSGELTADWRGADTKFEERLAAYRQQDRIVIGSAAQYQELSGGEEFLPPFPIPDEWHWIPLPELGELARGKSRHRPRNDPRLFGGDYPFVQTGDIRAAEGRLTKFEATYNDLGLQQSRLWPTGTVCITIAANIAETAILGISACFPDSVVGLIPHKEKTSSEFIEYFIRTVRAELEAFAPATAQKNINLETLRAVRIPIPPLQEQIEIVRRIDSAFARLDRMSAEHKAASKLLPKLDAAILAKAFRGELVPQDPNDEPASVLLERIKSERQMAATPKRPGRRSEIRNETLPAMPVELAPRSKIEQYYVLPDQLPVLKFESSSMTKSRQDEDVLGKPYLASLIKMGVGNTVQDLFKASDLPVDDFYKQLVWEIDQKHIRDDDQKLEAA